MLTHFTLLKRYGVSSEVIELDDATRNRYDSLLDKVSDTPYESALLLQNAMRREIITRLQKGETVFDTLPETHDAYATLRELLFPVEEQEQLEGTDFSRVIIYSNRITPQTVDYLADSLNVSVVLYPSTASSAQMSAIASDDLVVFDTFETKHPPYWRAKSLTHKRGAKFHHTTSTNADRLLDEIVTP
jgi:hypothetical protein